jgi:hypothetical protein
MPSSHERATAENSNAVPERTYDRGPEFRPSPPTLIPFPIWSSGRRLESAHARHASTWERTVALEHHADLNHCFTQRTRIMRGRPEKRPVFYRAAPRNSKRTPRDCGKLPWQELPSRPATLSLLYQLHGGQPYQADPPMAVWQRGMRFVSGWKARPTHLAEIAAAASSRSSGASTGSAARPPPAMAASSPAAAAESERSRSSPAIARKRRKDSVIAPGARPRR